MQSIDMQPILLKDYINRYYAGSKAFFLLELNAAQKIEKCKIFKQQNIPNWIKYNWVILNGWLCSPRQFYKNPTKHIKSRWKSKGYIVFGESVYEPFYPVSDPPIDARRYVGSKYVLNTKK